MGIAHESIIEESAIDKMDKNHDLLCHIDHTPCGDTAWVNAKKRAGIKKELSEKNIAKLRSIMEESGSNCISVVFIYAEHCEIID